MTLYSALYGVRLYCFGRGGMVRCGAAQALLAVPMWLLVEVGVYFGRFVQRRRAAD